MLFDFLLSSFGGLREDSEITDYSGFRLWFTDVTEIIFFGTSTWVTSSVLFNSPIIGRWSVLVNGILHVVIRIARPIPSSKG
jgi:hypothetical protein